MRTISGLVLLLDLPTREPPAPVRRDVSRAGSVGAAPAGGQQRLVWVDCKDGWCLEADRPLPREAIRHAIFIKPVAVENPVFGYVGVIRRDADWLELLPAIDPILARLGILDPRRSGRGMLLNPGNPDAPVQPMSDLCRFRKLQAAIEAMIGDPHVGYLEIEGRVMKNVLGLDPHLEFDGAPAADLTGGLRNAMVRR